MTKPRPWLRPICWIAGHRPDERREFRRVLAGGLMRRGDIVTHDLVHRLGPICRICLRCGAFVEKAR